MDSQHSFTPIGHLRSIFKSKNGTVRQSGLSGYARAALTIQRSVFNNPAHALENLAEFSHVWLIWVFHANTAASVKAKVAPPRLNGQRVGVFSTRSPHRPCPIGLTLARLEGVEGDTLLLSGVDMIDGTPVLDVKPYIPLYDSPGGVADTRWTITDTCRDGVNGKLRKSFVLCVIHGLCS